jgi:type IV pilus assembly protein PilY1
MNMINYQVQQSRRATARIVAVVAIVFSAVLAHAQWPNRPVTPLTVQAVADPNILVTFDDSGSMSWGAVPDDKVSSTAARRLAHRWNPLAYNPFVVYEAPYSLALDGTRMTTSFRAAPINGFDPAGGVENLATNYQSHWSYTAGAANAGYGSNTLYGNGRAAMDPRNVNHWDGQLRFPVGRAFFYSFYNDLGPGNAVPAPGTNPSTFVRNTVVPAGCAGLADVNNDRCYIRVSVPAAHEENFARWFSFYRTRWLLSVTGANIAFYDLPTNYRVAWQGLTRCAGFNLSSNCVGTDGVHRANPIRPFTNAAHRSRFFQWLHNTPHLGNTPLIAAATRAGDFYRTTGVESPIANQPGISMTGPDGVATSACRANYHLLFTDGIWNGGGSAIGNVDGVPRTLPDGTAYAPIPPFTDVWSGTLADVAFRDWAQDLQPTIPNEVIPYYPTGDTNYWNPRNDPARWQHVVTFTVGLGLSGFLDGLAGRPAWGGSTYTGSYANLLAGTLAWLQPANDSVNNAADLWHAALNSRGEFFSADDPTTLRDAFRRIIARINAGQTSSGQLASTGNRVSSGSLMFEVLFDPRQWTGTVRAYNLNSDGTRGSLAWTTDTTFTTGAGRNLVTWNTATSSPRPFAWTAFSPTEQSAWFDNSIALFNYLAGDRTLEGAPYRVRDKLLGDIVGSDLVVNGKLDLGYSALPGAAGTSYKSFVQSKRPMLYFGSNDGMIHGFRANGTEAFGYVPSAALPRLKTLAQTPFVYESRVDGPLHLGDAYLGGQWRSVLLAGLGGGGQSYVALDVTSLNTSPSGSFTASNVLFELNHPELGYTYGRPLIGRQRNGDWIAVFPNGYGGASRRAMLFIRNLTTGALSIIDTGAGTNAEPNGLSSPSALARRVGVIEAIYAGDYRGNLWKFEQNSSGSWVVANAGAPMFVANRSGQRQPITAAPLLETHPAGGVMVMFGTGKFFETQDRFSTDVQSFYAVRDVGSVISGRSALVQQTIVDGATDVASARTVSNNPVNYATRSGWFIDFTTTANGSASGERVVASPILLDDTVVFNTFMPKLNSCTGFGTSFLMGVGAFTGSLAQPVFDENGDGRINASDLVGGRPVAGIRLSTDGTLMSPVAQLVSLQGRGVEVTDPAASSCGGTGQSPCPGDRCQPGLTPKGGVCAAVACPSGSVMVNNQRCYLTARRSTWNELR